jgi:hypothetical protein
MCRISVVRLGARVHFQVNSSSEPTMRWSIFIPSREANRNVQRRE